MIADQVCLCGLFYYLHAPSEILVILSFLWVKHEIEGCVG